MSTVHWFLKGFVQKEQILRTAILVTICFHYMVDAIYGAISPGQYHFRYSPVMAALNISNFQNLFSCSLHVIKVIKSSGSKSTWLLTLGIRKSNARTLRAWAFYSHPSSQYPCWYGPFGYYSCFTLLWMMPYPSK